MQRLASCSHPSMALWGSVPCVIFQPAAPCSRQCDPTSSAARFTEKRSRRHPWQLRQPARHPQAAADRRSEGPASLGLWSDDLTDTSWGEGWASLEDSQPEEPPQMWPEPEVCFCLYLVAAYMLT